VSLAVPSLTTTAHRVRASVRSSIRGRLLALLDIGAIRTQMDTTDGTVALLSRAHHDTRTDLDRVIVTSDEAARALQASIDDLHRLVAETRAELDQVRRATGPLLRLSEIDTTTKWIELVDQPETMLVSVVMPTHNRAAMLPRSIGSLLEQRYGRWELLVVDDGSTDDTATVLDGFDDRRIRRLRADHVGCSGARNVALAAATGDVVVYLDDDNIMHPNWLKAVVWAFTQRPDVEVLYAARLIDDLGRVEGSFEGGLLPFIQFEVFDRAALEQHNLADIGALAHRAGLPEAHFDEQLVMFGDWDLLLRLTRDRDPLQLPVIAIGYATDSPNRLSDSQDPDEVKLVQAKLG
jgi:hypothetical protein